MPPTLPAPTAPVAEGTPRSAWGGFLRALTPRAIVLTILLSLLAAIILNPIFEVAFTVLLGRTMFVGFVTLIAGTATAQWRQTWVPKWVLQSLVLALSAPLATLAVYLLSTGGDYPAFINHEGRVQGFILISGISTIVGLVLALGALERQRDSEARAMSLQLALQREQLDRQAADVRLAVLTAQVEPHFLFNTLANVQALVETNSTRAPAVLRSLIAYLKATMPRLDDGDAQLGREIGLVRSYLELMQLRMPDRLSFEVDCEPGLLAWPCPPMLLLTLVENAVRHGIDPSEAGGLIEVRARRERGAGEAGRPPFDVVRLTVRDNGAGMSESALPGTGLKNLRERLAAFYGPAARLELTEGVPHGLQADVLIDVAAMTSAAPPPSPRAGASFAETAA